MATRIRGITVEIGGDTSGLDKSLKEVNGNLRETDKQLKDVERLLKLDPTNVELLAQQQQLLAQRTELSKEKVDALKKAQETMDKNGVDKTSAQYMALQREIIATEAAAKDDKKETDKLSKAEEENAKAAEKNSKSHEGLGTALKAAGAAAAAAAAAVVATGKALYDAAKETATMGDEIDKESQKLQISSDLYQKLGYAMEMSGSSIEDVKKGVMNITSALAGMANGTEDADKKFAAIGVSLTDAEGNFKSTEDVLLDTIDALASMEDETQRNAAANEIFGKGYSELIPLLNEGSDGISALMKEAEDYGVIMGEDAVKASADFSDSLDRLEATFTGLKNGAMAEFLPAITSIIDGLSLILSGDMSGTDKISQGVQNLLQTLQNAIPDIVAFVSSVASAVLQAAPDILRALGDGLNSALPDLLPVVVDIVLGLAQFLIDEAPLVVDSAISIILSLVEGLTASLDELIPAAISMINSIIDSLISNLDLLIDASLQLIIALALGLIQNLPKLVEKIPELIEALTVSLIEHAPELLVASIQIIIALARGLIQSIGILIKKAPELISAIGQAIANAATQLWNIGKDIVLGIWEGLKQKWEDVKAWFSNAFESLVGGVKSLLGIASPSKVFMQIGDYMAEGLAEGFVSEMDKLSDDMESAIPGIGVKTSYRNIITQSSAQNDATARNNALQQTAAGVVNGVASAMGANAVYTFNLVLPDGETLARYQLPALINVARSAGTPILNPVTG